VIIVLILENLYRSEQELDPVEENAHIDTHRNTHAHTHKHTHTHTNTRTHTHTHTHIFSVGKYSYTHT